MNLLETSLTSALKEAQRVADSIAARVRRNPARYIRWLPLQDRFMRDPARIKLFRAGNQTSGKTTVALHELICRCMGNHPHFATRKPPIIAWVICASREQSVPIQQKFMDLLPEDALINAEDFHPTKGFPFHNTVARFKNGSTVRFKTTNQGTISFAGATLDVVVFDEPPTSQSLYSEAKFRIQRRAGTMMLAMTPINAGPMDWLEKLVERGVISETWSRLTPEIMIPVGEREPIRLLDGTRCDAQWIAKLWDEALPSEAAIRIDGAWLAQSGDRYFPAFRRWPHHISDPEIAGEDWKVLVGIDHGEDIAKQVAVLCLARVTKEDGRKRFEIVVLDEYATDTYSTTEDDAEGILAMLSRNGLNWSHVDEAWGDREVRSGVQRVGGKGNRDLFDEMMRIIRKQEWYSANVRLRHIQTVKRGEGRLQGSVRDGGEFLHQRMLKEGQFFVSPACKRLIEAFDRWDGSKNSVHKDPIDALRYALQNYIFSAPARIRQNVRSV